MSESGSLEDEGVKAIPLMSESGSLEDDEVKAIPLKPESGPQTVEETMTSPNPETLKEAAVGKIPVALDSKTHLKEEKKDDLAMTGPGNLGKEDSDVDILNEKKRAEFLARPTVFRKCKETGDIYIVSDPRIAVVPSSRTCLKEEKKDEVLLMEGSGTPKEDKVKPDFEILKDEKEGDIAVLKTSFTISDLPSMMTFDEFELLFHPKYDMHTYSYGGGVRGCTIVFPSPEEALEGAKFVEGLIIQGLRICVEEDSYHDGLRKIWLTNRVTGRKAYREVS